MTTGRINQVAISSSTTRVRLGSRAADLGPTREGRERRTGAEALRVGIEGLPPPPSGKWFLPIADRSTTTCRL